MNYFQTGIPHVDEQIAKSVAIANEFMPDKIVSVYLLGSFTDGSHVQKSDIDLAFVVNEPSSTGEAEKLRRVVSEKAWRLLWPELDLYMISKDEICFSDPRNLLMREGVMNLIFASQLVSGVDIRHEIGNFPIQEYRNLSIETPLHFIRRVRGLDDSAQLSSDNLLPPNTNREYNGYLDNGNTKWVLSLIGWICTALVALKSQVPIGKKSDVLPAFTKHVGGSWLSFVQDAFILIREKLGYWYPQTPEQKEMLWNICSKLIDFERMYLKIYEESKK